MKDTRCTIAVILPLEEHHKEKFAALQRIANVEFLPNPIPAERLPAVDIIFGNPPPEQLKDAASLKLLHLFTAGSDQYADRHLYARAGVVLANASGAFGLAMSESMLAMHLLLIKKLLLYRENQMNGLWRREGKVASLYGSTVICVGVGDIGSHYATRLKAMGAYTIGVRRTAAPKPDFLDEVYTQDALGDIIGRADAVALALPSTARTRHILDRPMLNKMKKTAVVINVGRGSAIDTEALCDMLERDCLAGAALDVTDPEPLPPGHRLWRLKNAFITPHVTGGYSMEITHERIVDIGVTNMMRFINGDPLERVVDFQECY